MRYLFRYCFVVLFLILPFKQLNAQALVMMPAEEFIQIDEAQFMWDELRDNKAFAIIADQKKIAAAATNYQVLDEDIELDRFYWLHAMGNSNFDWSDLRNSGAVNLLWNNNLTALVRLEGEEIYRYIPRSVMVQPVSFRKMAQAPVGELHRSTIRSPESVYSVQAIVDSVNIDSIYYTERHLTGIDPFMLSTGLDSLQSRNSNNPQIFIAQQYLEERLQGYGYAVDLHPFGGGTFYDVSFAPGQTSLGWLSAAGKIYKTGDAGSTWSYSYQGATGAELWSVFPLNTQTVFAVGNSGTILKTTDGGTNWQQQSSPTSAFLFGVYFIQADTGFIAADNGIIMKTTNGGSNWVIKNTPISSRLYDIYFSDASNGWAVGRNGVILHSSDAGETWVTQSSGTGNRLYGTYFLNADTGFVVGWYGDLLKTVNGGTQWTSVNIPTSNYLYDIDFLDQMNGVIGGWNGSCFKTIDGGNTWTSSGNILSSNVYAIDYADSQVMWSAGSGLFAQSTNGGASWQSRVSDLPEGSLNNVIATKQGTTYPDHYYIICAHYDNMPSGPIAPGADDNGSGTAAVIEAARVLADYDFKYSIRFVLFSGEEQGLVGSSAYASAAAAAGDLIEGALNMDMIGYDSNGDGVVEIHAGTMSGSQQIGSLMVSNVTSWGLALTPQYITSGSSTASDHASFWNAGYAAIMHIEDFQNFTPYYHTTNDRLNTLNPSYFHENAKLTIGTLAVLAELDSVATGITGHQAPQDFMLNDPYPNPFNPNVTIEYYLPMREEVAVHVYDILGRKLATLVEKQQSAGWQRMSWDATDEAGIGMASGIYFIQLKFGNHSLMKKVILLR